MSLQLEIKCLIRIVILWINRLVYVFDRNKETSESPLLFNQTVNDILT